MNTYCRRTWLALLAATSILIARPALAASEDSLIKELDSPNADTVAKALLALEKQYPTSTKALPIMKKLLSDNRQKVNRKAARVLGSLHADVSSDDIKAIATLLKASDPQAIMDGLKSLRGLKAQEAVPEIIPFLQNPTRNVVRDACRALSTLGDKKIIPLLEPLLKHADAAVQKDAADAIHALNTK